MTETDVRDHGPGTAGERHWWDWWHESHPTFAALTGFFSGMLFVTAVPGGFAGVLRLLFHYDTAAKLFPFVLLLFLVPTAMLFTPRTRRFAKFMWLGMIVTVLVVGGVTSLVLYFMVQYEG